MKKAFNKQGLNPVQTTLQVAALAVPAILMTAQHYGWTGLCVAAAFTASFSIRRSFAVHARQAEAQRWRASYDSQPASAGREQTIANGLAQHAGTLRMPVYIKSFPGNIACTDGRNIYIDPAVTQMLNDREMAWVIAHEMDHVRHDGDAFLTIPFTEGAKVTAGMGMLATFGAVTNTLTLPGNPDLVGTLAVSAGAAFLLHLSAKAVQRQIELRCDANALRMTGDFDAAMQAWWKLASMANPFPPDTPASTMAYICGQPLRNHPLDETRLRNLEKTWRTMQAEQAYPASP